MSDIFANNETKESDFCSIVEFYNHALEALSSVGIDSVNADIEIILSSVLKKSRGEVAIDLMLNRWSVKDFIEASNMVKRRLTGEPIQHITSLAAFRYLELQVAEGVFIPRPETELLVEHALNYLRNLAHQDTVAVDICSGSGAIAISINKEFETAKVYAVERSKAALYWLRQNIAKYNSKVEVLDCDYHNLLANIPELKNSVDIVLCNPPYIPSSEKPIDITVYKYDPHEALFSGEDGLDDIRDITILANEIMRSGAMIIFEHTENQGSDVRDILKSSNFVNACTLLDLTQRERYTLAYKK